MKIANKINTILCDDVRREVGGKISIMGIYSKDIVVHKVPVILPNIHLVIMLDGIKESLNKIFCTVFTPKSDPAKLHLSTPLNFDQKKNLNLIIGVSPFKINGTGPGRFEIRFSESEKARIIHRFLIKTTTEK